MKRAIGDTQPCKEFFDALSVHVPAEARILTAMFRGDPADDTPGKWRAKAMRDPDNLDPWANIYVCVSAMGRNAGGEFRRRKENFVGGLCLMVDDLGTGRGAKQPLKTVDALPPTALIETSPDNFQAIYLFDRLETDAAKFEALIRAFVQNCLLSPTNSGMDGINRVFRPPLGVNGKAKYKGEDGKDFVVQMAGWWPERRYSIEDIAAAYRLELVRENRLRRPESVLMAVEPERRAAFLTAYQMLKAAGMVKSDGPNMGGWIDIVCPWRHTHTDAADNGASIRVPEVDNEFYGAFRCHHGHCDGKGWRDLTEWLATEAAELLDWVNNETNEFEARMQWKS